MCVNPQQNILHIRLNVPGRAMKRIIAGAGKLNSQIHTETFQMSRAFWSLG